MNWKTKRILITGSEGMIGKELVIQLQLLGADVIGFDLKEGNNVRKYDHIEYMMQEYNPDYVFHLFGIKGNPKMTRERPVDFMGPMLQGDTNMILAAQKYGVKRFLYTSSIAVEHLESDKYPAWAKQTAETLIEAMRIQYKGTRYCIVRPCNVYGRFDNFDNPNAMVITSLIKKALSNPILEIWGDGSQVRDFINSKDVARGMIKCMERMPKNPTNLCFGKGVSIRRVAKIISEETGKSIKYIKSPTKHMGPNRKVMGKSWFTPKIALQNGIIDVINHVREKP